MPQHEHGAGGVLNDRHGSGFHDIEGFAHDGRAKFRAAAGSLVGVVDLDIAIPMWGNACLLFSLLEESGDFLVFDFGYRIGAAVGNR